MIDVKTASRLLDFGARIGSNQRSEEQLLGTVAIYNILCKHGFAYLADEVGMGKTYVALGALALFRHFDPNFRVMIIAPNKSIQNKWMKEFKNFVKYNVRFPDMRIKDISDQPVKPLVYCEGLVDAIRELSIDANRDFFLRFTSFSFSLTGKDSVDPEAARKLRNKMVKHLPWLKGREEIFDLRNKQNFKDNFARAFCCALPIFDLIIVDEAHNLKHGFGEFTSARNRMVSLALGRFDERVNSKLFPNYAPRAKRVLLLSATPIEETYRHLWNQLDIFSLGKGFEDLKEQAVEEERKKELAKQFLVRRVTIIRTKDEEYTKNMYRREWRQGGVIKHDEPIEVTDDRQRLVVALVQKKVSELLGSERFKNSFQIGMLASFESFMETAKIKKEDDDEGTFDDSDQTYDEMERDGIDVADLNKLAKSYRYRFDGSELPHPKMDAVVESLSDSWKCGKKTLVFVRRVASVKELKRKIDEKYNNWIISELMNRLPESVMPRLKEAIKDFKVERDRTLNSRSADEDVGGSEKTEVEEKSGTDTFFAWFFRGDGPKGLVSGANVKLRFIQRGGVYATFFEDNHVAAVLGCIPGEVTQRLASAIGVSVPELKMQLRTRSQRFLSRKIKHARADRFGAVQAAAIEWLKEVDGPYRKYANVIWNEVYSNSEAHRPADEAPEIGDWLELPTFFTELRLRENLRKKLWPEPKDKESRSNFREEVLRAQLLAAAARHGHAFIDLYVMIINRLKSLAMRVQEAAESDSDELDKARIEEYLDILERQMETPLPGRSWSAFDELSQISDNFHLILDINCPDAWTQSLSETARAFGQLLRQQKPIGGMSGQVNQTLVRQFRMPGYPLILVTTDLLQEGEDLHLFCSSVQHYGISWTPSSMEQRIGRIDRVRSMTERLFTSMDRTICDNDKLQVYYPYLQDTVEVLQVQRVLKRMDDFLKLMHEGLSTAGGGERKINVDEILGGKQIPLQITGRIKSSFPVLDEHLKGNVHNLAVDPLETKDVESRFKNITKIALPGIDVIWENNAPKGTLLGTVQLGTRQQPFILILKAFNGNLSIRCVSPVGRVYPGENWEEVQRIVSEDQIRVGAILTNEDKTYDLTVEGDVLLGNRHYDCARVAGLVKFVAEKADLLEKKQLQGIDQLMVKFKKDLSQERTNED